MYDIKVIKTAPMNNLRYITSQNGNLFIFRVNHEGHAVGRGKYISPAGIPIKTGYREKAGGEVEFAKKKWGGNLQIMEVPEHQVEAWGKLLDAPVNETYGESRPNNPLAGLAALLEAKTDR